MLGRKDVLELVDQVLVMSDVVGVGLLDDVGVGLVVVVFGQGPVDAGRAGAAAAAFPGGDDQVGAAPPTFDT